MATYIKTLKEDNGDIVYPQTTTDAIYTTGGETLETRISKYVTAEDIAQSVAAFGTVTTGMLADDAVTTAKIDDSAVTTAKISDDSITTAKISDGAVTLDKIDSTTLYTVLFSGDSTGTVTLSDSAANYAKLKIFFYSDNMYNSVEVVSPNSKKVVLMGATSATTVYFHFVTKIINGTSITNDAGGEMYISGQNACNKGSTYNGIHITRVEGWNI